MATEVRKVSIRRTTCAVQKVEIIEEFKVLQTIDE